VTLLTRFKEAVPRTRKIIMYAGFPSICHVIEAENNRAHGYILKPFEIGKILETIKEQLKKQHEEKEHNQKTVIEFTEARVREPEMSALLS
jgi:DNA-binding NtrC family response regulator